jgi:hypothetical protein
MRAIQGQVHEGLVVPDTELREGTNVTILVPDEEGFDLSSDQEEALLEAIAEADRGDVVPAREFLDSLRRR